MKHCFLHAAWQGTTAGGVECNHCRSQEPCGDSRAPVVTRVEGGCSAKVRYITPPKIHMEHNHTGLEDHVPF